MNGKGNGIRDLIEKYGYPIATEETRKRMPKELFTKTPPDDWLKVPKFFTPEEVKDYGYDLHEGWMLKLTPDDSDMGFAQSLINPKGEESSFEDVYKMPSGEWATMAELETQYAGIEGFETDIDEMVTGLSSLVGSMDEIEKRLAGDMPVPERMKFEKELAGYDIELDEFIKSLKEMGQTPETESFLRLVGMPDQQIGDFFLTEEKPLVAEREEESVIKDLWDDIRLATHDFIYLSRQGLMTAPQAFYEMPEVPLGEDTRVIEGETYIWFQGERHFYTKEGAEVWHGKKYITGSELLPSGAFPPEFIWDQEKPWTKDETDMMEAIRANRQSTKPWTDKMEFELALIREYEGRNRFNFTENYISSLWRGTGGAIEKYDIEYAKVHEEYETWLEAHPELAPRAEWDVPTWDFIKENWLNTNKILPFILHKTLQQAPQLAVSTGAFLGTLALTKNPWAAAGAASATFAPMEIEELHKALREAGCPEEEAQEIALYGGISIASIEMLGELPFIHYVAPKFLKSLKYGIRKQITRLTMANIVWEAGKATLAMEASEVVEENLQLITLNAFVKAYDENRDIFDGMTEVTLSTALAIFPMALGVGGMHTHTVIKSLPQHSRDKYNEDIKDLIESGIPEEVATQVAFNNLAETEEGKTAIAKVAADLEKEGVVPKLTPEMIEEWRKRGTPEVEVGVELPVAPEVTEVVIPGKPLWEMTNDELLDVVDVDMKARVIRYPKGGKIVSTWSTNLSYKDGLDIFRQAAKSEGLGVTVAPEVKPAIPKAEPGMPEAVTPVVSVKEELPTAINKVLEEHRQIRNDIAVIRASLKGKTDIGSRLTKQILTGTEREISIADRLLSRIETKEELASEKITQLQERLKTSIKLAKTKLETIQDYKTALVDLVNTMPLEVRGKMVASIKNIKTAKGLETAANRAIGLAEQYNQKMLKAEIYKEIKRTQAVVKDKILRGKFTAETQRILDTIRHNLELSREDADAKLVANFDKYNKGEISWEDMHKENEALNFVGIKEMTSQELMDTLEYIKILREIGKSERQAKREVYKEKMDAVRADIIDTASGGKGSAKGIYSMPKSEWQANSNWVDKLINWMYNWDSILDKISKFKREAPFKSKISVFGAAVHRARHTQHFLRKQAQANAIRGLQEVYKTKDHHQLNRILNTWKHEVITLGEFELAAIEGVEEKIVKTIKMTKGQMMVMYNLMKDPTLDTTFRNTLQWTDEIMEAVRNNLSVEEKAYADWTMDFMKNNRYVGYDAINKVYSEIYGVDLNNNPYYFPAFRDMESQIFEDVLTFQEARGYASVLNGSLKVRVSNVRALKFSDITDVMSSHIIRQAHFIAWGQTMRDMRSVFGNREVRETIEQYHGEPIMREITKNLNDMARDGVDVQTLSHQVNWLRGNFTRSILGVKPSLLLKQIPSFIGYASEMSISNFVTGVADFWLHPVENYKFMLQHSPYLQERFGVGFERDVHFANVQKPTEFLSGHKPVKSYITENIRFGDKFAVTQGMWAKMQSELKGAGVTRETATEEQILKALQAAEDVTNRTQPAFDIETLAPLQRGGAWVKLFTMFQTQPAQYFRMIGNNFRNFQYHRGSRAKAISNIILVWCILPALWQFIADGFQWKEEHQLRAVILGQLNWMLIVSQLAQSSYDWAVGEPFDYQASPVLASVRDFLMGIGKVRKVIGQGQDPYKDISMDDVIAAIEFFGKSAGQVTGYPTPYLIQMEKALRHYYQDIEKAGEDAEAVEVIKRLIFSEWSLEPPNQSLVDKAQDVADKLGELIKEVDEVRAEYGLPGEYYGMKVLASRFRDIFEHTLLSEITKEKGFNELAVAWAEMEMARQSHADLLPGLPLYKINTDDTEGLTIIKLHQLWEARSRLTRLPDIVELDKTWSDVHIEHGNVTRQQYDLLVKYLETPDEDKKQFVKDHPGLKVNRRDEWLKANPEDNARLALWGKAKLLSQEAHDNMQKMIDELDIPESGLPELTLPPEGSVESYFEREEAGKEYGWNSPEARLVLAKDDVLRDWLGLQPVTTPIASLELQVNWREEIDLRDAWGDRESPLYIEDDDARQEAYDKQYANNPDFRDDIRRVEGYGFRFPDDQIENYVEYYNLPEKGYEQERYLLEHPQFYQSMIDLKDKVPFDEGYKVPEAKYDEIYHEWEELFEEYENVIGTESEREMAREAILRDNPEFRKARRRREAYGKFIPEKQVEDYVGYYEIPPKSSDEWYVNYSNVPYYEDDWYLLEHPKFYEVMTNPMILGDDAWKLRDFSNVPTREVFKKYKSYLGKETSKSRLWYRCQNKDLDDWLVKAKGLTPAYGKDRCLFNQ